MLDIRIAPAGATTAPGRCSAARCGAPASRTPVLRIALFGSDHVSRIRLPAQVCASHAVGFTERFLTDARRATIESALRSRGRNAPDWSRTEVVFE